MRMNRRFGLALVLGAFVAAGMLTPGGDNHANARPTFPKLFVDEYSDLTEKVREAKCTVCHPNDKNRMIHNGYGKDLKKILEDMPGEDNWKDKAKVTEALQKNEKNKSSYADGKTWGDILKSGELPNGDNGDVKE